MALLSAKQLKHRESPEIVVDLGDGDTVLCRRPDLQTLIFQKFMPMPLMGEVASLISQWMGKGETEVTEAALERSDKLATFVDRWLVASMVAPRAVLTHEEVLDDDTICILDLRLATKSLIFKETFSFGFESKERTDEVSAATEFPEVGSSEGSRQDGEAVRPAAVIAGGD